MSGLGMPPPRTFGHVAVLMGGLSAERSISLKSGTAVADALESEGYRVTRIDVGHDVARRLDEVKPEACFNALHGKYGEDGCIQGILETMAIPYTHSGVLSSALAMHKERAKAVMKAAGVPVAEAKLVTRREAAATDPLPRPYVVKPVDEGSSVGVVIVRPGGNGHAQAILEGGPEDQIVMAERFIAGRELTCAVIGNFVTDVIEIVPRGGLAFYDFEAKYAPGGSEHELPAKILPDVNQLIRKYTLAAHDFARVPWRVACGLPLRRYAGRNGRADLS